MTKIETLHTQDNIGIDEHDDEFYDLVESVEIKPCPFCGSDDIKLALHQKGVEAGRPYHLYSICCCECRVSNWFELPKELFGWWNSRASDDDQD